MPLVVVNIARYRNETTQSMYCYNDNEFADLDTLGAALIDCRFNLPNTGDWRNFGSGIN
jgi:hypothetical protein